jgi:transposase
VNERIEAIRAEHPSKRVEVWFQDEARFGQRGTNARVWARTGSRPRAVRQQRYDYLYVLAGVCPETGRTAGLLSPHLNTDVVNAWLRVLGQELDDDVHAVLIWDRAGYHTSGKLRVPPNVTIIELPPRSPELNPTENLWHYLRDHHWSNRAYDDYDDLRHTACDSWHHTCLNPQTIQSVCRVPYLHRQD